jgi:hypothetical protein
MIQYGGLGWFLWNCIVIYNSLYITLLAPTIHDLNIYPSKFVVWRRCSVYYDRPDDIRCSICAFYVSNPSAICSFRRLIAIFMHEQNWYDAVSARTTSFLNTHLEEILFPFPVSGVLTLIVLMWRIGWAHNNARK